MTDEPEGMSRSSGQTSLATFDCGKRSEVSHPNKQKDRLLVDSQLRFEDNVLSLLGRSRHAVTPTELVLVPVDLHRRVIKHRLAGENQPRDSVQLCKPVDVAAELIEAKTGTQPGTTDRIDRLPLLEEILEEHTEIADRFGVLFGVPPVDSVKLVEQARTEVEAVTGYHPERIEGVRNWCQKQNGPLGADALDLLTATVETERHLRYQTDRVTSNEALVRWACREVLGSDGGLWQQRYPTIRRVWFCGASTVSASLVDFLTCLLSTTNVGLHVYLRNTSGPLIRKRLPQMLGIESPGNEVFDI